MIKDERTNKIMEILQTEKYVTVQRLVEQLHYSPATVRRDITYLANCGIIKKCYGGITIKDGINPSLIREREYSKEKVRMCKYAAKLINDHDRIFIDGSTSTYFIKNFLDNKKDITIVTSNIKLALELGEIGADCYVTGGKITDNIILSGYGAIDTISKMSFDVGFFSVGSFSEDGELGLSDNLVDMTRAIIERSKKAVCLCDGSKFNKKHFLATESFANIDCFISNIPPQKKLTEKFPNVEFITTE